MRVDIEHVEKKVGLIRRETLYGVKLHITFSEEELYIIKQNGLEGTIVLERPPSVDLRIRDNDVEEDFYLYLGQLLRGPDTYWRATPLDAKAYEAKLTEEILPMLKGFITENAGIDEKKKTLEF